MSKEHLELSNFIKNVHENLRNASNHSDPDQVFESHKNKEEILEKYSNCMKKLSKIWEENDAEHPIIRSRNQWTICYCEEYFLNKKIIAQKRCKELKLIELFFEEKLETANQNILNLSNIEKLRVLDVGSCFNPLSSVKFFDVTALDLYPSESDLVFKGDFLKINLRPELALKNNEIESLPRHYYQIVVFSLLLEYLPSSDQRIKCCKKAYELLQYEGILVIVTPDSKHVGANAKLMKNWRYTLANLGFSRIKFEKLSHITCMVFRKSLIDDITLKWATIHKEDYMKNILEIPQK